jgi:arylsulfatase A
VRWPGRVPAGKVEDAPVINTDWLPTLLDMAGQPLPAGMDGVSLAGLLTGRGPAPKRSLFRHFPHYTNQGSRPSGAMRDDNWMLIEFYDDPAVELYDLTIDVRETSNVAARHPDRVTTMRAALAAWRREINTQENRPNPDFVPAKYRELYGDEDPSQFDPLRADQAQWIKIWTWRKGMNSVLPRAQKAKS